MNKMFEISFGKTISNDRSEPVLELIVSDIETNTNNVFYLLHYNATHFQVCKTPDGKCDCGSSMMTKSKDIDTLVNAAATALLKFSQSIYIRDKSDPTFLSRNPFIRFKNITRMNDKNFRCFLYTLWNFERPNDKWPFEFMDKEGV
jgi:hypothetical protein